MHCCVKLAETKIGPSYDVAGCRTVGVGADFRITGEQGSVIMAFVTLVI